MQATNPTEVKQDFVAQMAQKTVAITQAIVEKKEVVVQKDLPAKQAETVTHEALAGKKRKRPSHLNSDVWNDIFERKAKSLNIQYTRMSTH